MNELPVQFAEILARLRPVSDEEYHRHIWATEVRPTLLRWGLQERHIAEIDDFGNAQQRKAFETVCRRMCGVGAIVALIGVRGCGKTTIAAQFARAKAWQNHRHAQMGGRPIVCCRYLKAVDLVARFRALYGEYHTNGAERLAESRDAFCRELEYLVIDELHEVGEQKVAARLITDILDRRYAAKRDTLLISNQTPAEFQAATSDSVLSRLQEHGAIVSCTWESWRKKNRRLRDEG